jgi:hypothetical protein
MQQVTEVIRKKKVGAELAAEQLRIYVGSRARMSEGSLMAALEADIRTAESLFNTPLEPQSEDVEIAAVQAGNKVLRLGVVKLNQFFATMMKYNLTPDEVRVFFEEPKVVELGDEEFQRRRRVVPGRRGN